MTDFKVGDRISAEGVIIGLDRFMARVAFEDPPGLLTSKLYIDRRYLTKIEQQIKVHDRVKHGEDKCTVEAISGGYLWLRLGNAGDNIGFRTVHKSHVERIYD